LFERRRAKFVVAYRTDLFLVPRLNNLTVAPYLSNFIWAYAGQKIIKKIKDKSRRRSIKLLPPCGVLRFT
jgi:hypothetical protein